MPMPISIVLADAISTVTTGPIISLAYQMAYGNTTTEYQFRDLPIQVYTRFNGAAGQSATVQIQVSKDGVSFTNWGSAMTLLVPTGATSITKNFVGAIKTKSVRVNVTAIGTGTVNSYVTFGKN
jgi:hypothetical protein